jgi:hypothetical protein
MIPLKVATPQIASDSGGIATMLILPPCSSRSNQAAQPAESVNGSAQGACSDRLRR